MRRIISEKYLVVFLFILVIVIFSFAQRDSKKLEQLYNREPAMVNSEGRMVNKSLSQLVISQKVN